MVLKIDFKDLFISLPPLRKGSKENCHDSNILKTDDASMLTKIELNKFRRTQMEKNSSFDYHQLNYNRLFDCFNPEKQ